MSNDLTPPSPERFGLASFADLLSSRPPILGEEPQSFEAFHDGLMRALTPFTPYECVVAENLVAIEWELFQQRRMRDAGLRTLLHEAVRKAVISVERTKHDAALDAAWEAHVEKHGDEDWEEPFEFGEDAAEKRADDLADRAVSRDPDEQARAQAEITGLGLSPIYMMSAAYTDHYGVARKHDAKVQELERRRREVKRDYDALQKTRPFEAEVVEG